MELGYLRLPRIQVHVAKTVEEALKLLEQDGEQGILAGGTYTVSALAEGKTKLRKFVDISRIRELAKLREENGKAVVGALVTHAELSKLLGHRIPALKTFWKTYSAPTVANLATVGGSVMLRKSSEDLISILLVLDAELRFQTSDGESRVKLCDFMVEKASSKKLLTAVSFEQSGSCYFEKLWLGVSRIPIVSVALNVRVEQRVELARVAVSHKDGNIPNRVYAVERFLEGRVLDDSTVEKAVHQLSQSINPLSDIIAPAWYRREAAAVLFKRLLKQAAG
ncbi:MAG: FAD binding domain-containing protein [Candidatus Caldarchaeum sp.]